MSTSVTTKVVRTLPIVVAFAASCADAPTAPTTSGCQLASVGPTLAMTPPSVVSLSPLIGDAQTRLAASLGSVVPTLTAELGALQGALAGSNAAARCEAFNQAAHTVTSALASAPSAALPDLEAVRLVLRLVHVRLVTNS